MSQPPPLISQSPSQPVALDDPSPITVTIDEGADIALEPLRLGFENVWTQTVQNVRQVMSKMQKDANRVNTAERRKNVNLMRCLVSGSEKLKGQEWAMEELRKENGSLMDKARQNEQFRRENKTAIDTLNQENHGLRRENEELRKKNGEVKEALRRATEFIFQYKEELAKVKADAETFRKCREASVLSVNDQTTTTTMTATDLHREITRLHAEKERERIFNDAVKQLRALTAVRPLCVFIYIGPADLLFCQVGGFDGFNT
jgi:myosin heavy subunit